MEIAKGAIGSEGSYEVAVTDGNFNASAGYKGADLSAGLQVSFKLFAGIDFVAGHMKKLIKGEFDDKIIDAGVTILKNILK